MQVRNITGNLRRVLPFGRSLIRYWATNKINFKIAISVPTYLPSLAGSDLGEAV